MLLKKECLFCGIILIDMIDNDIDDSSSKLFEFAPVQTQAGGGNTDLGPNVNMYNDGGAFGGDQEWGIE